MALRPGFTWMDEVVCRTLAPRARWVCPGADSPDLGTQASTWAQGLSLHQHHFLLPPNLSLTLAPTHSPRALFTFLQQPFSEDLLAFRLIWQQSPSCIPAGNLKDPRFC